MTTTQRKPRAAKKAGVVEEPRVPQGPSPPAKQGKQREGAQTAPKNARPASRVGGKQVVTAQDSPKKKKRPNCMGCQQRKTKCEYQDDAAISCKQCTRLSVECQPPPVKGPSKQSAQATPMFAHAEPKQAKPDDASMEREPVLSEVTSNAPRDHAPRSKERYDPARPQTAINIECMHPSSKKHTNRGNRRSPSDHSSSRGSVRRNNAEGEVVDLELGDSEGPDNPYETSSDSDSTRDEVDKEAADFLARSYVDVDALEYSRADNYDHDVELSEDDKRDLDSFEVEQLENDYQASFNSSDMDVGTARFTKRAPAAKKAAKDIPTSPQPGHKRKPRGSQNKASRKKPKVRGTKESELGPDSANGDNDDFDYMGALDIGPEERKMLRFNSRDSYREIWERLAEKLDRNASRLNLRYRVEQNGTKKTVPTQISDDDFDIFLDVIRPFFTPPLNANGKKSGRGPPKNVIVVFLVNGQATTNGEQVKEKKGKKGKEESKKLLKTNQDISEFTQNLRATVDKLASGYLCRGHTKKRGRETYCYPSEDSTHCHPLTYNDFYQWQTSINRGEGTATKLPASLERVRNTTQDKVVCDRGPGGNGAADGSGDEMGNDVVAPGNLNAQVVPTPKAAEANVGMNLATAPLHMQAQYYGHYNQGHLFVPQPPPYPQALNHQAYPLFNPHGPQQIQPPHQPTHLNREEDTFIYPSVRDWLASIDAHPSRVRKDHPYSQYAAVFEANMFDTIDRIPMNRERWSAKELSDMLGILPGILESIFNYLEGGLPAIRSGSLVIRPVGLCLDFRGGFNNVLEDPQSDYTY